MKATGHTCCKLVFTNTEQQGKQRIWSKNTDEYCSKNRWWSSLHERKPNKIGPILNTETSSTNAASKPKKADIILCAHSIFCWGSVGDASARAMPYEMLVPRCECVLQRVNCHFIRALCAPSISPCGSCRMVMDGGHQSFFWRAFGTEHACESPRHGSPQAGLFLSSVHVVLSFVLHFKELRN